MGAKNLKAIAVHGTEKSSVSDRASLKELDRYTAEICDRVTLVAPQV